MTSYTLVTNNPACQERYHTEMEVLFDADWTYRDVLERVRDCIAAGKVLVTHPLAGSLKPNQTPFRSVILANQSLEDKSPYEDQILIENSLENFEKFRNCRELPRYSDAVRKDFGTLDLSFVESAMAHTRLHP